jgi:hypothetical protein
MALEEVFAKRAELARLGEQITELAGHLNAGEYRFLVLVEAFDREDGWQGEGIRACQRDLNHLC